MGLGDMGFSRVGFSSMGLRLFGTCRVVGTVTIAGLLLLLATQATAQDVTRYISDELEVGARVSEAPQSRIIRTARSGERVTVLEQNREGYSRVRFGNGTEAWLLTRYLQNEPHAREQLAAVQAELDEIRSGTDDQAGRIAQLLDTRRTLEGEQEVLQRHIASLEAELGELRDVAARPQEIRAENTQLRETLFEAQSSAEDFRRQVEVMRADSQRKWFMTGALVTVGSLIFGMLLTRLPRRRRSSEW